MRAKQFVSNPLDARKEGINSLASAFKKCGQSACAEMLKYKKRNIDGNQHVLVSQEAFFV